MTNIKPRVLVRICRRDFVIGGIMCGLIVYGLAHTEPVIVLAWRTCRGTWFEPHIVRWAIKNTSATNNQVEIALANGTIHEGQPVRELRAKHGPFSVLTLGPYQIFRRYTDYKRMEWCASCPTYVIIAKEGKLRAASAGGHGANVIFFDTLSKAEYAEIAALDEIEYVRVNQVRLDSQIAVSSGAFYEDVYRMPQPNPKREARIAVAGVGAYTEPDTKVEE